MKLDEKGRIDSLLQAGVSDYQARYLTRLELLAAEDFEKATGGAVQRITGQSPKCFKQFAEENKMAWSKEQSWIAKP